MGRFTKFLCLSFFVAGAATAQAGQNTITNYNTARDDYFWDQLYTAGGQSLYCAHTFEGSERVSEQGEKLTIEHAYPADWIAEANGCKNRRSCPVDEYGYAEADLHNLWPALGRINSSRGKLTFDEVPGESHRRFTAFCPDYERTSGTDAVVEPRDSVKGDLARSLLYMSISYNLPLQGMGELLLHWHVADPPDDHEHWRNRQIERLQGTRNPFIDHPEIANLVFLILSENDWATVPEQRAAAD